MSVSVLVSHPVHFRLYEAAGIPVRSSPHGLGVERPEGIIRIEEASFLRPNGPMSFVRSLHQVGSMFVDLRSFSLPFAAEPFRTVYGPGTDRPMLRTQDFSGLGLVIPRDDPQVRGNYAYVCAVDKVGPIGWIRPGFPAVLHLSDWYVEGRKVRGALASSIDRPGGFVILEVRDLVQICGYAPQGQISEQDLVGLVPYECLCRILDWAEALSPVVTKFEPGRDKLRSAAHR